MRTFENKTQSHLRHFGRDTQPEGQLILLSYSDNSKWMFYIVEDLAGDRKIILKSLSKADDTYLLMNPAKLTADLFTSPEDHSTFQRLPLYVRAHVIDYAAIAPTLIKP